MKKRKIEKTDSIVDSVIDQFVERAKFGKEKYNTEIDWIETEVKQSSDKIFFICDIDIPWQEDPLREHPNLEDRKRIFNRYVQIMEEDHFNYHIINGNQVTRLKKCIELVDNLN